MNLVSQQRVGSYQGFKKTMIIEVRELTKNDKKESSELKLIKQKVILEEKKSP